MRSHLFDSYQKKRIHKSIYLSVVIPTHNRCESLGKVLNSLNNQINIDSKEFEILVIDDGSNDLTRKIVEQFSNQSEIITRVLSEHHKGPAGARNVGIKNACGEVILFMGDDTIGSAQFLFQHYDFHRSKHSASHFAVLGYCPMVQAHNLKPAIIQSWLNRKQMAFQNLSHLKETTYHYFYTCNLSVKRAFMLQNGLFNEQFPFASGEDIELGKRLSEAGMRLYYNKNAIAYHIHPMSLTNYIIRYFKMGRTAVIKKQIENGFTVTLTSSRKKFSPFMVKNPLKIATFIMLYVISITAVLSGVICEKRGNKRFLSPNSSFLISKNNKNEKQLENENH